MPPCNGRSPGCARHRRHTCARSVDDSADVLAVRRAVPLTALRRTIAQRMTQSTRDVPQFNLSVDVNMARLLAIAEDWKQTAAPMRPKSP